MFPERKIFFAQMFPERKIFFFKMFPKRKIFFLIYHSLIHLFFLRYVPNSRQKTYNFGKYLHIFNLLFRIYIIPSIHLTHKRNTST